MSSSSLSASAGGSATGPPAQNVNSLFQHPNQNFLVLLLALTDPFIFVFLEQSVFDVLIVFVHES